jgi:hypothetical protein
MARFVATAQPPVPFVVAQVIFTTASLERLRTAEMTRARSAADIASAFGDRAQRIAKVMPRATTMAPASAITMLRLVSRIVITPRCYGDCQASFRNTGAAELGSRGEGGTAALADEF